jgi:hypothetical protein
MFFLRDAIRIYFKDKDDELEALIKITFGLALRISNSFIYYAENIFGIINERI